MLEGNPSIFDGNTAMPLCKHAMYFSVVTTCKFQSDPTVENDRNLLRYWNAAIPLSFIAGDVATFAVMIKIW